MTRRLRMAGVGLSAFLLPACMNLGEQSPTPYYTGIAPGYVQLDRPAANPAPTSRIPAADKAPPDGEVKGVPRDQLALGAAPVPPAKPDATPSLLNLPDDMPTPPPSAVQTAKYERPCKPCAKTAQVQAQVQAPIQAAIAVPAGAVIASPWPIFTGSSEAFPSATMPDLLPPVDAESLGSHPAPPTPAQPLQPGNMIIPESPKSPEPSVSLKVQESPAVGATVQSTSEPILMQAIKAFHNNRPQEAIEILKHLDTTNQELLMYLMPLVIRLSEGNADPLPPDELAMLIDRLQAASGMLKSKAALRAERVSFCRGVRKFADLDLYEPGHEFRPGEMVFLYAELKNFTREPVSQGPQGYNPPTQGCHIRLATTLEIRDSHNGLIWRKDLSKTDFAQTPPQDYFHTYRFFVPDSLPPGTYTLWMNIVDKPSGRAVRKPVEMRVGRN